MALPIEWQPWAGHPNMLIADCGELRGEWPTYAPTTLPQTAVRVGVLVCLPPPSGNLDDVLNHSYPTPYVWAERWGFSSSATSGEYRALADGGWTGSLTAAPSGLHVYALWKQPSAGDIHPADGDGFSSARRVYLPSAGTYVSDGFNGVYLTTETDEPVPFAASAMYHTCWWTYSPAVNGSCTIHTELSDPDADTILAVYTGNAIDNLDEVVSNDDGDVGYTSSVTFPAAGGAAYRIQVGSYANDSPPSSLVLSVTGPQTVAATAPPTYFGGETITATGGDPSMAPLELVPQGVVVGSTGGAHGGRSTGRWSDWQPSVERLFTVPPDGAEGGGYATGCYITRIAHADFNTGDDPAGPVEGVRQALIGPAPFSSNNWGPDSVGGRLSEPYPAPHDGTYGLALGCHVYSGYNNPSSISARLTNAAASYRASQWRTRALYDPTQDMQSGVDYLPPPGGGLVGNGNVEKAFNYFANHGYTKEQAAGIVGNMIHESGVEPARKQGTGSGVITMPADVVDSSLGWGIVQWTPAGKMINPSRAGGVSDTTIASLEYQLDFLRRQLSGETAIPEANAGQEVRAAGSVEDAAVAFGRYFERFAGSDDLSNPEYAGRKATALAVFGTYSGGSGGGGGGDASSGSWTFPLPAGTYTVGTPFGKAGSMWSSGYHTGQDFACPTGTPAFASAPGAIRVQHPSWAGNLVRISIGNGLEILYAHLSRVDVSDGQQVTAGQQIGLTGDLGNTTGPHLHFEVRQNGDPVDPMPFLTGASTPGSGSGGVGGSGGTSGGVDYEDAYATFLGWEPFDVDVRSAGNNYQNGYARTMPGNPPYSSPYTVYDFQPFLPTQPLSLRIAKTDYQPLSGGVGQMLDWKPYGEGTALQNINLGYSQREMYTNSRPADNRPEGFESEIPLVYIQELTTALDFGDDQEDLTVLLQLSVTGPDPLPFYVPFDWNWGDPLWPNVVASNASRGVEVDGIPRSLGPSTSYPQARYRIPRWRYWIPGPVPDVIVTPSELGELTIGSADRPPINFW